mmetsp:Transcript_60908/g.176140  ORF Transcript_60908/g.176140 Transcript_60908/m.176140 type:complete len:619 (+) Transcript_60908:404-2260(+)
MPCEVDDALGERTLVPILAGAGKTFEEELGGEAVADLAHLRVDFPRDLPQDVGKVRRLLGHGRRGHPRQPLRGAGLVEGPPEPGQDLAELLAVEGARLPHRFPHARLRRRPRLGLRRLGPPSAGVLLGGALGHLLEFHRALDALGAAVLPSAGAQVEQVLEEAPGARVALRLPGDGLDLLEDAAQRGPAHPLRAVEGRADHREQGGHGFQRLRRVLRDEFMADREHDLGRQHLAGDQRTDEADVAEHLGFVPMLRAAPLVEIRDVLDVLRRGQVPLEGGLALAEEQPLEAMLRVLADGVLREVILQEGAKVGVQVDEVVLRRGLLEHLLDQLLDLGGRRNPTSEELLIQLRELFDGQLVQDALDAADDPRIIVLRGVALTRRPGVRRRAQHGLLGRRAAGAAAGVGLRPRRLASLRRCHHRLRRLLSLRLLDAATALGRPGGRWRRRLRLRLHRRRGLGGLFELRVGLRGPGACIRALGVVLEPLLRRDARARRRARGGRGLAAGDGDGQGLGGGLGGRGRRLRRAVRRDLELFVRAQGRRGRRGLALLSGRALVLGVRGIREGIHVDQARRRLHRADLLLHPLRRICPSVALRLLHAPSLLLLVLPHGLLVRHTRNG